MAKTVEGQSLDINALNGGVSVDNAKVIQADIEASNGVIHVIDTVVLPQERAATGSPRTRRSSAPSPHPLLRPAAAVPPPEGGRFFFG
jgi:hypothetical protein